MKNWKLSVYEALIERLVNLAALEGSPLFQDAYLDALDGTVAEHDHLRRSCNVHCESFAPVHPVSGYSRHA